MDVCENMTGGQLLFIGLGIYSEKDVSLQGLTEIKQCDTAFAEFYTSKLIGLEKDSFEQTFGKTIEILTREETEKGDRILEHASKENVVFLTCGDPMIATTHVDLRVRAIRQGIKTKIIHSGSIITAAPGLLGLQSYKFGRTTTLAFPEKDYFPTSPYTVILENKERGLHTLILLDIQDDKQSYMTANEGLKLLLKMEEKMKKRLFDDESIVCVVARAGSPEPIIAANTIKELIRRDFGAPLHTLIIPGALHFMEVEALEVCAGLPQKLSKKLQKV